MEFFAHFMLSLEQNTFSGAYGALAGQGGHGGFGLFGLIKCVNFFLMTDSGVKGVGGAIRYQPQG